MMTISGPSLIVLLVIAAVCGAVGKALAGGSRGGLITSIAFGFIGALLGTWVASQFRLRDLLALDVAGHRFPIVWSIAGAALFVAILHLSTRRKSLLRI
ncbi:MAG TPA: hypothetical protein VGY48_09920 [Vicinamibacterales bacterium]|jgi:uncharacterized membrane protein YeaQ/YmgE (transglycosylase-associated protein family)|nr:hypothetical protein [Vicinamibacterales bacterium]